MLRKEIAKEKGNIDTGGIPDSDTKLLDSVFQRKQIIEILGHYSRI